MRVITVARKPLQGGSVAENVTRYGTGGLNIDSCRIEYAGDGDFESAKGGDSASNKGGEFLSQKGAMRQSEKIKRSGRWPANVILEHRSECCQVGTKKVRSGNSNLGIVHGQSGVTYFTKKESSAHYADADGLEEVPAWECSSGCPVAELDRQSGVLTSGGKPGSIYTTDKKGMIFPELNCTTSPAISDTGGASRFFKQVKGS